MATLYITELASQGQDARGWRMVIADMPPAAEQTVAITGASVQSATLNPLTKFIRITTDSTCSLAFGVNPTASATKMRMFQGSAEYFAVPLNAGWKVAVIANT